MDSMARIQPHVEFKVNHRFVFPHATTSHNQPMVKKRPGELIKDALASVDKTQSWLAEQIGVSNNAVSKWIATDQISKENIQRIAFLLGIPSNSLLPPQPYDMQAVVRSAFSVSENPARPYLEHNTEDVPIQSKPCPLLSWVQAGNWSQVIDNFAVARSNSYLQDRQSRRGNGQK